MKFIRLTLCILCVFAFMISCKSDVKNEGQEVESGVSVEETSTPVKQDLGTTSLLVKTMSTPEAKMFTSALVTTQLTDLLNGDGPYTIFAPSTSAFNELEKSTLNYYLNPENKETFSLLIKNHVVEADLSSADILQAIKKNKNYELKTLGGAVLTVSMKDGALFVKDSKGVEASLGKTDILGSNGKLHILDKVLNTDAK